MKNAVNNFKKIMSNQNGVAILLLFTTIAILTALLANFTFETNVNQIRLYNQQDRYKARLNAQAGLKLAMAQLKLYQKALNYLEKKKELKKSVPKDSLDALWSTPFILPMKVPDGAGLITKTAIEKFKENLVIEGKMVVSITNISNKININFLRVAAVLDDDKDKSSGSSGDKKDEDVEFSVENQLREILKRELTKKKDEDLEFNDKYGDADPLYLIAALKHYVSDKDSYDDEYVAQLESAYHSRESGAVTPKHAALSSLSEIYHIEGWNDATVDLIKNEITAHGNLNIDLNKITKKGLSILLPNLEEEQMKEFFDYRDDSDNPVTFNGLQEFQEYIVNTAQFIAQKDFEERIKKFQKAGIIFGTSSTLFEVKSTGSFENISYTLTAFVSLDPIPVANPKIFESVTLNPTNDEDGPETTPTPVPDDSSGENPDDNKTTSTGKKLPPPAPVQYLSPKIVELRLN